MNFSLNMVAIFYKKKLIKFVECNYSQEKYPLIAISEKFFQSASAMYVSKRKLVNLVAETTGSQYTHKNRFIFS